MRTIALIGLTCALVATPGFAEFMVADSTGDRIMLFDSFDGSLINADWISDSGAVGWAFSTPKEATVVGNQIWVADQIEDAIHRFDMGLNFVSSITTGPGGSALDNLRSLGTDGTNVWLTTDGGAYTDSVITYDTSGNPLSVFNVNGTSPFDAEPFKGDLLVSDTGASAVQRHAKDGTFLGTFASGISFPEQVVVLGDDSVLVANAIDSAGIEGIWHYNADGSVRTFIDTAGIGSTVPRGANLLGNGNYLVATSTGIFTASPDGGGGYTFNLVGAGNGQYITFIPEPAALSLLALGGLFALRRR